MTEGPENLRARVDAALGQAIAYLPRDKAVADLRRLLEDHRQRFPAPMRVALVGRVSAGKSTLANALLGGRFAATGRTELTYNVNWFRNAAAAELTIHYKEGGAERVAQPTVEALIARTARGRDGDARFLATIDYVEFAHPNARLKSFDLIDTPGLDSVYVADSANALRFLGLDEEGVRTTNAQYTERANAVVHVLPKPSSAREYALLGDFLNAAPGKTTPVKAVGALTKIEDEWSPDQRDVMAVGRTLAKRLMDGGMNRKLYDLRPVAGLVGQAAATLAAEEFDDLCALALRADPATLVRQVKYGNRFGRADSRELPVPPQRRSSLFDRLGAFGITLSCDLIRDGVTDRDTLCGELFERSGLAAFHRLLVDHFGARADLIKLQDVIADVEAQAEKSVAALRGPAGARTRIAVERARTEMIEMAYRERGLDELDVVHKYYAGELSFSEPDAQEALRIVGEHGTSPRQRLGLPPTASTADLIANAHRARRHWAMLIDSPDARGGATGGACRVVRRCLDALIEELSPSVSR